MLSWRGEVAVSEIGLRLCLSMNVFIETWAVNTFPSPSVCRCAPSAWTWGRMSLWTHWARTSCSKSFLPSPETTSNSLQMDIHSTFLCMWTCTHTVTHTLQYKHQTSTILHCCFKWSVSIPHRLSLLWPEWWKRTLTGWTHLKERRENSPDFSPFVAVRMCVWYFKEVPVLRWFLVCNLQYWLDC